LENYLLNIYLMHFKEMSNIDYFLKIISNDLINSFSQEEVNFLVSCYDKGVDLIALEFHLRKKNKNNIISFVFFRLSSLAETIPQNQDMYVNKFKVSILTILQVLLNSIINLIIFEFKRFVLAYEIKEYNRCMK